MTTWKVRSLRVSMFLSAEAAQAASVLDWEHLTGLKPENTMNRGDQQLQEGPFSLGRLLLQKQLPGRLDIVYAGFPQPQDQVDPVATVGTLEEASQTMSSVVQKLFNRVNPCLRLALGAEMVRPAATAPAAYQMLVEQMRSATFRLEGGHEFVYQINRPRRAKAIADLLINRLTRWHASSWQPFRVDITGVPNVHKGQPKVGAVITTDVNTDGDRVEPIPSEKLLALFEELRDLTFEIRDQGDIQ